MKGRVMWTCGSMNPGKTYCPAASITSAPGGASSPRPIRVTISPSRRTSAFARESAVTTSPFRIRSAIAGLFPPDVPDGAAEPAGRGHLLLGVELDGLPALDVEVAVEGGVPSGEGKHGHGGRDPDVDSDHPRLDPVLEFPGRRPR